MAATAIDNIRILILSMATAAAEKVLNTRLLPTSCFILSQT